MTTMKAVRFTAYKTFPELKEIERPTPGPGEVLLKVAGAGACHSDVAVYDEFEAGMNPLVDPEYTLGHETSGWVEELGAVDTDAVEPMTAVIPNRLDTAVIAVHSLG